MSDEPKPAHVRPQQYTEPTDRREYVEPHTLGSVKRTTAGGTIGTCSCGEPFRASTSPSKGGGSFVAAKHAAHVKRETSHD